MKTAFLTVRETADLLHMHFMSVYKLVQTGRLPATKIGSRWKIDPGLLQAWIAGRTTRDREWLLVGGTPRRAKEMEARLGGGHRVESAGFGDLGRALTTGPDVVVIDPSDDRQAALAALAVCREAESAPLTALLVTEPDPELLREAMAEGLVTLLPAAADGRLAAQVDELLVRRVG